MTDRGGLDAAIRRAIEVVGALDLPSSRRRVRQRRGVGWPERDTEPDSPVLQLGSRLRNGRTTVVDLVEMALERAHSSDWAGCFTLLDPDRARQAAASADAQLRAGRDRGPLHGLPMAVKDVIDVAGLPTGSGLHSVATVAPRSAAVVAALQAAGAIVIGKTRTPPLAWAADTFGVPNPHAPGAVAGGSSGGSAAAVAAGIVPFALGTDTGGSIRIPAALCGVVGLRTTHGAVSLQGVAPLAPSQDAIGLVAATAHDCRLVLSALPKRAGQRSPRPAPSGVSTVLVPEDAWVRRVDPEVEAALGTIRGRLQAEAVRIVPIHLPLARAAPAISYLVMFFEASTHWANVPGVADSTALRDRLAAGAGIRTVDYLAARRGAVALRDEVLAALATGGAQAVLLPSTPIAAPPVGAERMHVAGRDEATEAVLARLTALASVTGLPAVSLSAGCTVDGRPIGVQLIGAPGQDAALLRLAELLSGGHPPPLS